MKSSLVGTERFLQEDSTESIVLGSCKQVSKQLNVKTNVFRCGNTVIISRGRIFHLISIQLRLFSTSLCSERDPYEL